jgi:DNA invertase Pin-like site-specific DNA recombinase
MSNPKFVIYARVSTAEQGASGLGVEAQTHACQSYVASVGGEIVKTFIEVASGDDDDRPVLAAALKLAKRSRAVLLVAKLDRLSRAVALVAGLLRRGAEIRVAECATANVLELQVRSIIAEEERRKISERTRDALAAAKRRGVALGSSRAGHWAGREERRRAGAAAGSAAAAAARRELRADIIAAARPIVEQHRGASLRAIAAALNAAEISTPGGASWRAAQVQRLLATI